MHLASGRAIAADAALVATQAGPSKWFETSGLPRDAAGFIAVRPTLQVLDDDDVFAVGDCATVLEHPREKSGVFAVRQGPPLAENLRLRARGNGGKILHSAERISDVALDWPPACDRFAQRARVCRRHRLALKDRIDRAFMDKFNVLPAMAGMGGGRRR